MSSIFSTNHGGKELKERKIKLIKRKLKLNKLQLNI